MLGVQSVICCVGGRECCRTLQGWHYKSRTVEMQYIQAGIRCIGNRRLCIIDIRHQKHRYLITETVYNRQCFYNSEQRITNDTRQIFQSILTDVGAIYKATVKSSQSILFVVRISQHRNLIIMKLYVEQKCPKRIH